MNPAPIDRTIERLVIICPSWVGDTVMATPLLRAAREALPVARIIGAMRPGLDELLAGTRWLDEVIVVDSKARLGPLRMAAQIRAHRPQVALLLPNSFRAAVVARLGGAGRRVGYNRCGRGVLLTDRVSFERPTLPVPMVEYYDALCRFAFGLDHIDQRVELAITDEQREAGERLLDGVPRPFVLLNPGANKAPKRWPAERFAAVADALAQRHGLAAVATGSPHENAVVEAVVEAADSTVHNLVQRGVGLGSLKAVIERASVLITNDTGPRHIAAALGTPVVTLFGPTDHRWTSIDCPSEWILLADPFLPEHIIADRHPEHCAIHRIAVSDVVSAAAQLLAASAPAADAGRGGSPASTPPRAGDHR